MSYTPSVADKAFSVIHDLCTFIAIIATFVLMGQSIGAKSDHNSLFLTNTFLSTYYSDVPSITYSPSREPHPTSQISSTFYGCLFEAQVGVNDAVGCTNESFADYHLCITSKTTSPAYRKKHLVGAVQKTLSEFKGNSWNISTLPSLVTTPDMTTLGNNLFDPLTQNQIIADLRKIDSILSRDLLKSITVASSNMGIPGCILTINQSPGILHDIAPVYDMLWQCVSGVVHTETANHKAFDLCIPQSAWPALDVMQTPYSTTFLGSYNKHFVVVIGMWLLCSFAVYSSWVGVSGQASTNGKPLKPLSRAGIVLTTVGFVWNFSAIIIVLARGFTPADTANNFPMSIQTVLVTMLFSIIATMYFGREMWEIYMYGGGKNVSESAAAADSSSSPAQNVYSASMPETPENIEKGEMVSRMRRARYHPRLGTFVKVDGIGKPTGDLYIEDLAPLLIPAWSDSLLVCDGLILLGVIGTSPDVVTADIVLCFFYIQAGAALHSAFIRLLREAYQEKGGDEKDRQGLRVMTMVSDMAIFMFLLVFWYLALIRYKDAPLIQNYVIFSSMLPTIAWLFINIIMDFDIVEFQLVFPAQIIFIYNIVTRSVFVFAIASSIQKDIDATFYNDNSLLNMIKYISNSN